MKAASFPPRPRHSEEVLKIAGVFASVVEGPQAVYVSTPLTGGLRSLDWKSTTSLNPTDPAYPEAFRREVLDPNREQAKTFVRDLRSRLGRLIIDPTGLPDVAGWTQDDYRTLWAHVIERYVEKVVFRDGWEYSDGCAYEFFVSVRAGVRLAGEDLSPLERAEGIAALQTAIQRNKTIGIPAGFLAATVNALRRAGSERTIRP